jgi:HAMP domain-containing protein
LSQNNRKLSNLLVNPGYQIRYIFWLTSSGLLLVALNGTIFYVFMRENYEFLVEMSPLTEEVKALLREELQKIVLLLAAVSVVFLALLSTIGLFFSHRTAGPLYHFKRIFSEIRSGKPEARVHLRPDDDFRDVASEFNAMMDLLAKKEKSE